MGLQSVYALVDLAFVGRLGADAVAGLGISLQAFFLVLAISQVVSTAVLARVSQRYGAGNVREGREAFTGFLIVAVGVGLAAAAAAYFSAELYVGTFTADPGVHELGLAYFRITSLTFLFQLLLMVIGTGMRASGDFITPMKVMATSVTTNMILDPLLIFGLGPFPEMGLEGAAWATVIAQVQSTVVYLWLLLRPPVQGRALRLARPRLDRQMAVELAVRGLPAGVQYLLLSLVMGIVLAAMKPHGPIWTATAGGGFRVVQQTILPLVAMGFAAASLAGQNLGANLPARIRRTARVAMTWACGYAVVLGAALFFGGRIWARIFADAPAELDIGEAYFRWSAPMTLAFAMTLIPTLILQGVGRSIPPLLGAVAKLALLLIIVTWIIPWWGVGPVYVFAAATLSYLVEGGLNSWLLISYLRKLPSVADLRTVP